MSKRLPISYENKHCYNIEVKKDFSELIAALKNITHTTQKKVCIVTDSNVNKLYGSTIKDLLASFYQQCTLFEFQAGEENKHLETVKEIFEHLIEHSFDRKDLLIALGGGVTGDITGFAASTYLRGIDFVQIPTTLLAQVDSSIGGKTGIDFLQYKNMIGAFYMPKLVYINISVLHTLPARQFSSGMGEIIKHGLIQDREYYYFLKNHIENIQAREYDILETLIYRSLQIKGGIVERDPHELAERALLNFGHTVGHAIEKLSDFQLAHGECVALGMIAASYLSYTIGNLSKSELLDIEEVMEQYVLSINWNEFKEKFSLTAEEILKVTKKDKKMEAGRIKFILLSAIGSAYITRELSDEQILSAIAYMLNQSIGSGVKHE